MDEIITCRNAFHSLRRNTIDAEASAQWFTFYQSTFRPTGEETRAVHLMLHLHSSMALRNSSGVLDRLWEVSIASHLYREQRPVTCLGGLR